MAKKTKTRPCDAQIARERLRAARSYLEVARRTTALADESDPYRWSSIASDCVVAGIAAADALCCMALGEHAQGDDHRQAIDLVGRVSPGGAALANALSTLLGMKTVAGYGVTPLNEERATRAMRAASRLVDAARERL
jgi:hypothetical protein